MRLFQILVLFIIIFASTSSYSQPPGYKQDDGLGLNTTFNVENTLDTDLDDGGEFSLYRIGVSASFEKNINRRTGIGVGIDYSFTEFDFSGSSGIAVLDPWNGINTVNLDFKVNYQLSPKWRFTAIPLVEYSGESGADFDESLTWGGLAGFTYTVNRDLIIGTGVIATTRIEDDFIAYPGAILNWRINEDATLSTILTGVRTSYGPKIRFDYSLSDTVSASLNTGYEFNRFRLDDEDAAPDGVGDFQFLPIWASASYNLTQNAAAEIYAGTGFLGEMELEDSNGDRILKDDFDQLYFFGVGFRINL